MQTRSRAATKPAGDAASSDLPFAATSTTKSTRAKAAAPATRRARTAVSSTVASRKGAAAPVDHDEDELDQEENTDVESRPAAIAVKPTRVSAPRATASRTVRGRVNKSADEGAKPQLSQELEAAPGAAAAPKSKRGRPKKAPELVPAEEPVRPTRTTRKAAVVGEPAVEHPAATVDAAEKPTAPVKKTTARARASSTVTKTAGARAAAKKTVTFEEPEKENIDPVGAAPAAAPASRPASRTITRAAPKAAATKTAPAASTTATTGVRGRARKPTSSSVAATTTARASRSTRAAADAVACDNEDGDGDLYEELRREPQAQQLRKRKALPLSPKQANTHLNHAKIDRTNSDDELAADEKPAVIKAIMRKPVRPAATSVVVAASSSLAPRDISPTVGENGASAAAIPSGAVEQVPTGLLASPIRRPVAPAIQREEGINSLAKRIITATASATPGGPGLAGGDGRGDQQSPAKMSAIQSPAKRPAVPFKPLPHVSGSGMKASLLSSPAKRPLSPIKGLGVPAMQEHALAGKSPMAKLMPSPAKTVAQIATEMGCVDVTQNIQLGMPTFEALLDSPSNHPFSGRLSSALPRHADPVLNGKIEALAEEADRSGDGDDDEVDLVPIVEPSVEEAQNEMPPADQCEPVVLDELEKEQAKRERNSTTPPISPPKQAARTFGLREKDLRDDSDESESDNEPSSPTAQRHEPMTPCPAASQRTPGGRRSAAGGRSTVKQSRTGEQLGFTPLANQLRGWRAGPSPIKTDIAPAAAAMRGDASLAAPQTTISPVSPMRNQYFEDEMLVRAELEHEQSQLAAGAPAASSPADAAAADQNQAAGEVIPDIESPDMDDVAITAEDVDLATEANEMSLLDLEQVEDLLMADQDQDGSDDEQQYGDENAVPIDPALLLLDVAVPPETPQRVFRREVHTVTTKVPLKSADESTPRPRLRPRSHSISRLPAQSLTQQTQAADGGASPRRPAMGLRRNATVISYSPSKRATRRRKSLVRPQAAVVEAISVVAPPLTPEAPPATPARSEAGDCWSIAGTPARTPRRDLDPALLGGCVVFVDVRTSDGADASAVFMQLLTDMGARCVSRWSWSPTGGRASSPSSLSVEGADEQSDAPSPSSSSSKIGITHVVFKDGSKRTLEKVRASGGVVQCVGVAWVLDCERENAWVDEAPYLIDTSLAPRGPARRRKSMEPQAIANLNGVLVPTPGRANAGASFSLSPAAAADRQQQPSTPTPSKRKSGRRASSLWIRTPEDMDKNKSTTADDLADAESAILSDEHADLLNDQENDAAWAAMLAPVPKTPAPEAIARFVADLGVDDSTLGSLSPAAGGLYSNTKSNNHRNHFIYDGDDDDDDDDNTADYQNVLDDSNNTLRMRDQQDLLMRTCPPKPRSAAPVVPSGAAAATRKNTEFSELGAGVLGREKDERILMRLVQARRKSLQFAPKIGSPLAKAWN